MRSITIELSFWSLFLLFFKCILLKIGFIFFKKIIKDKEKKSWGEAPPGRPGAFCLFAGLLAGHDRGDHQR